MLSYGNMGYYVSLSECDEYKNYFILVKKNNYYVAKLNFNDFYYPSKYSDPGEMSFLKSGFIKHIYENEIHIKNIYGESILSLSLQCPSINKEIYNMWNETKKYIDNLEELNPRKYYLTEYISIFSFNEFYKLFGAYLDILLDRKMIKMILLCLKHHKICKNIRYYILDFLIYKEYKIYKTI